MDTFINIISNLAIGSGVVLIIAAAATLGTALYITITGVGRDD